MSLKIVCIVLLSVAQITQASTSNYGVDDWDSAKIATFFSDQSGHAVTTEAVAAAGIAPVDLFDGMVTSAILTKLGMTDITAQDKLFKALAKLDLQITKNPGDFFEWRTANLRLFDTWIMPLSMGAPRSLALWARYIQAGDDSGSEETAQEKVDDVVDSSSVVKFWSVVTFVPSYHLWEIVADFNVEADGFMTNYCDTLLSLVFGLKGIFELLLFVAVVVAGFGNGGIGIMQTITAYIVLTTVFELTFLTLTFFGYYIGWYLIPMSVVGNICFRLTFKKKLAELQTVIPMLQHQLASYNSKEIQVELLANHVVKPSFEAYSVGLFIGGILWSVMAAAGYDFREMILDFNFYLNIYFTLPLMMVGLALQAIGMMLKKKDKAY